MRVRVHDLHGDIVVLAAGAVKSGTPCGVPRALDARPRDEYSSAMRVHLIHNPVAGPRDVADDLVEVVAYLESQGWELTQRTTLGPGDATTFAREAVARGADMVVAVGGDGTLSEVVNGLAGTNAVLGFLPVGTGNVWAHMVGIPVWGTKGRQALLDAARILVEGRVRRVDLGKARDRYFALWLGMGFDAQVAGDIEPHRELRRSMGNVAYLVTALALCLVFRGTRLTVVVDGRVLRQRAVMVVISNAQLYGPTWRLAPRARLDDGLLDVYIFRGASTLDVLRYTALLFAGQHMRDPKLEVLQGRRLEIRGSRPLPFHLDGDPAGYTPVRIEVAPKALRVMLPAHVPEGLLGEDA
ncbi:MAG: diacylglycerol kinase family protein [Chloroflexota bacterium]